MIKRFIAALLILLAALPGGSVMAEAVEPVANEATLEKQLVQMNAWVAEAIACREAGSYAEEAAILETIVSMHDIATAHPDICHDEVAWPAQARWAHQRLGDLYAGAEYGLPDIEKAIVHYIQAASPLHSGQDSDAETAVHSQAALALGDIYAKEAYGRKDLERAIAWYRQAKALGPWELMAEAEYRLALLYADPAYGLVQAPEISDDLYDAANHGHPKARALLEALLGDDAWEWGWYHWYNEDFDLAIEAMLPAAEQGDVRCMKELAYLYDIGYTGKGPYHGNAVRDVENAMYWYTQAAEAGDPEAMERLAAIYLNGDAPDMDPEEAIAWALKAVDTGDAPTAKSAKICLGRLYQARGDDEQAEVWYLQAEAWSYLGRMYRQDGCRDVEKAVLYLEKAAGLPEGNFDPWYASDLLSLYADPDYGPRPDKAAALYKAAYEHGYYRNLYNLAMLYLDEDNEIADEKQGIYWMYQSASHGDTRAREWFERLNQPE